jgi:hypothetical protein
MVTMPKPQQKTPDLQSLFDLPRPEGSLTRTENLTKNEATKEAVIWAKEKGYKSFEFHFRGAKQSSSCRVICLETNKISPEHPQVVQMIENTTFAIVKSPRAC